MTSRYVGGSRLRRALKELPEEVTKDLVATLDFGIRSIQATAINRAPYRTGNLRKALAQPSAIGKRDKGLWVEFGFRTKQIQKMAFYAPFVEFGTKGYNAGDERLSGVDRHGRPRYKRIRRFIPARPAQPFMRPAFDIQMPIIRKMVARELRNAVARASRG